MGGREGYRERVNKRAGKREEMESEKNPNNMKGEASTDHRIGEGLG